MLMLIWNKESQGKLVVAKFELCENKWACESKRWPKWLSENFEILPYLALVYLRTLWRYTNAVIIIIIIIINIIIIIT